MKRIFTQHIKPLWLLWLYAFIAMGFMAYSNLRGDRIFSSSADKWERGAAQHK